MIVNIKEIYERLCDSEDWDPIVFENHRGQKLCFEQVATLDYEGEHYAYLYEIDEHGEHVHDFPAVLVLDDENKTLDFVTDNKLVEDISYEVVRMRRGNGEDGETDELYDEDPDVDEFYDMDEEIEDENL